MGKERREPYRKGKRGYADVKCRPNGGCSWCLQARTYQIAKAKINANINLNEWIEMPPDDQWFVKVRFVNIGKSKRKFILS